MWNLARCCAHVHRIVAASQHARGNVQVNGLRCLPLAPSASRPSPSSSPSQLRQVCSAASPGRGEAAGVTAVAGRQQLACSSAVCPLQLLGALAATIAPSLGCTAGWQGGGTALGAAGGGGNCGNQHSSEAVID